ncbi:MAG: response regulator [Chloroflexi bacterium]|nr:response regulator [Chloroflexota bacterium]
MNAKPILLVDDEIKVLNSLSRTLSEENFDDIKTTQKSQDALEIIKRTPDLALIISDYRMPGMNGIELLSQVHQKSPDVTRILLTGAADLDMALDAINKGHIFRFLLKPCSEDILIAAVKDGLRQNELITSERDLLKKTLYGSIKVMIDTLSVLNPGIFAQSGRLRNLARDLAAELNLEDQSWEIELAALLSQIGTVTIPNNIIESWHKGEPLEEPELKMIRSIPRMGKVLIRNIPRLENIAEAVGYQNCTYRGPATLDNPSADRIPLMSRILKVLVDFDVLIEKSHNPALAFQAMLGHEAEYDPNILTPFRLMILRNQSQISYHTTGAIKGEKELSIDAIRLGMVLSRDVIDKHGTVIVAKGALNNEVLLQKLINCSRSQTILDPIYIESGF